MSETTGTRIATRTASPQDLGEVVKISEFRTPARAMGGRVLVERVPQASSADRDAILASLFAERRELNRAKRLGTASANQLEYLSELNDYINSVEAAETREAEEHGVWAKLEDLASAVVDLQVKRSK